MLVDSKRVGPPFDTVGVWGSNPHAPTNRIKMLRTRRPRMAAFCVIDCEVTEAGTNETDPQNERDSEC